VVTSTLMNFSVSGLGVLGTLLALLSEWGIYGVMFVFFLFKMTAMETDVLRVRNLALVALAV
jgi:hypothetical protein